MTFNPNNEDVAKAALHNTPILREIEGRLRQEIVDEMNTEKFTGATNWSLRMSRTRRDAAFVDPGQPDIRSEAEIEDTQNEAVVALINEEVEARLKRLLAYLPLLRQLRHCD